MQLKDKEESSDESSEEEQHGSMTKSKTNVTSLKNLDQHLHKVYHRYVATNNDDLLHSAEDVNMLTVNLCYKLEIIIPREQLEAEIAKLGLDDIITLDLEQYEKWSTETFSDLII